MIFLKKIFLYNIGFLNFKLNEYPYVLSLSSFSLKEPSSFKSESLRNSFFSNSTSLTFWRKLKFDIISFSA